MVALRRGRGGVTLETALAVELRDPASVERELRALGARLPRSAAGVHCNLGGVGAIVQQADFPPMELSELRTAARIEAEQLIPDIERMVLDVQMLGTAADQQGGVEGITALLVAAPREAVTRRRQLLERARYKVLSLVPDGIALANAVIGLRSPEEGGVLAVDVGREGTNLVAAPPPSKPMAPTVRYVPGGMDLFVEESGFGSNPESTVARSREAQRGQWLREVERSLEFISGKLGVAARHVLVVGDGARLPDLLAWLEENLRISVEPWNPLADLERAAGAAQEGFVESHGFDMAVAVGLALPQES